MLITLNTKSKTFQSIFTTSLLGFSILLFSSAASSWTNPSGTPPNNNVSAPVNVSSTSQIKSGPLQVNGFLNSGSTQLNGNAGIGRGPSADWRLAVSGTANGTYSTGATYGLYGAATGDGYGVLGVANTSGGVGVRGNSGNGGYAGYFVSSGTSGGLFAQNGSGYYAYLGYPGSSWGVFTNGNTFAAGQVRGDGGFCIGGSCITSWPTASTPVNLGSYAGRSVGSTYTAGTDGFVVAYTTQTEDTGACVIQGYTGSSIVASASAFTKSETDSLMFPIAKGSSYSVKLQASYMTRCGYYMYWIPLD